MATVAVQQPHDVPTTLNYYAPVGDESPYIYVEDPPEGKPKTNIGADPHSVVVHDVRGKEDTVGLDKTGFQYVKHKSVETEFLDEERIKTVYYKEVEELLKKTLGVKRVFIFDHTIRRNYGDSTVGSDPKVRGPVDRVHIDQTFDASVARVHRHLGADAERLLKGRVRIINVWRPINAPVAHNPLAVADYRTLNTTKDLIPVRFIYPDRVGGTFSVKYAPELTWYYLSGQTPEEVTLIKCFDSDVDKARLTPHSAFTDPTDPPSAPKRQSIEVRTLVFDEE
ncbi:methyltransferase [Fomitiporia mediterranea MF3/22]|uniref:methyltransferase n=1 Tax=Fomitiporia mediterranea (strain MF3/22) TaxID=694068 RepID=UPI0004407C8C|nr:methyltransferase [Fomitiporia mediterranea MF3/22]EJC98947.1 methyltransferase [Fomitiporia mediterranea MF3/22]